MMKYWLWLCCALLSTPALASDKLIQLIEYIGADYKEAVQHGQVVNTAEYAEMQEFANLIVDQVPAGQHPLQQQAQQLQQLIAQRADEQQVQQVTANMRKQVIAAMPAVTLPSQVPDLARGRQLFETHCAACHGDNAAGDGPAAAQLDPAPTDFHQLERYRARSLFGLFNTISLGVEDTAMAAFAQLDVQSRWELAFYVGAVAAAQIEPQTVNPVQISRNIISELITATPADLEQNQGAEGAALMALFRQQPGQFFDAADVEPLQIAIAELKLTQQALKQQQYDLAYQHAVDAYLDGFELIEGQLTALDTELKNTIEQRMLALRQQIKQQQASAANIAEIIALLTQAQQAMAESELSPLKVFLLALLILLREGLEALLVVAAIYSVAVKTGQTTLKRSLHVGWLSALALGALTWLLANYVITISGATRELTEGYAALLAAGMLFYMGFWMHSKTSAAQWQQFIGRQIGRALSSGAYWGLSLVVFLAVYREVFETILFYQALWLQGGQLHQLAFVTGITAALFALLLLAIALFKFAVKLPLKAFFGSTALLMIVLAVIMTGKGIAALQESGVVPLSQLALPSVSWLGLYPSVQGIAVQGVIIVLAVLLLRKQQKR